MLNEKSEDVNVEDLQDKKDVEGQEDSATLFGTEFESEAKSPETDATYESGESKEAKAGEDVAPEKDFKLVSNVVGTTSILGSEEPSYSLIKVKELKEFSNEDLEELKSIWRGEFMQNMPLRINTEEVLPMAKQLENEINVALENKDEQILNELNQLMTVLGKIKQALNQSEVNYSQFTPIVKRLKFELFGITH